jgi:DNA-binding LacI/PurR family transcriptional regulator
VWFADHLSPPLTTIRMPLTAMGRRAVEILAEQIDGHPPQRVMINDPLPVLRIRSSTAAPPMPVRSSTSPMPSES